jgi:WG containing repeat
MKLIISIILVTLVSFNSYSQELVPFRIDSLWGYKDKIGTVKIEPQFQYATIFMGDVAIVAKDNRLGAIDRKNNQVIPYRYEYLHHIDSSAFLFGYKAKYFGEYIIGVMNKEEKVIIPPEFSYIAKYRNSYLVTKNKDSVIGKSSIGDVRTVISTNGLYNINGNVIIPCKYQSISWATESVLVVDSAFATEGGKYSSAHSALFTNKGEQLTGFDYKVFGKFIDGIAKAKLGDKFGFIYPTGKIAIPIVFDYCEEFSNGYALFKQQDKWGAIDKDGKIIIEPKYAYEEVKTTLKVK